MPIVGQFSMPIDRSIVLDEKLIKKCLQATGLKTKRAVIDHALRELLRHARQKKISELKGTIHWEGELVAFRRGRVQ